MPSAAPSSGPRLGDGYELLPFHKIAHGYYNLYWRAGQSVGRNRVASPAILVMLALAAGNLPEADLAQWFPYFAFLGMLSATGSPKSGVPSFRHLIN